MPRFDGGWVSISRRVFLDDEQNNEFFGDMPLAATWLLLIAWANVRTGKTRIKGRETLVQRGELVTSQDQIGAQLGVGRIVVRRCLDYLVSTSRITMAASRSGTLITVLKYDEYQNPTKAASQPNSQAAANEQPTGSQAAANEQPYSEQGNKETGKPVDHYLPPTAKAVAGANGNGHRPKRDRNAPAKSALVWDAYSTAYLAVHGDLPVPNATIRSQACQFVDKVGADLAPAVAEYYVLEERAAWIIRDRHPWGELLHKAQKYLTNYRTGTKVTTAKATAMERDDHNANAIELHLARKYGNSRAPLGGPLDKP